MKAPPQELSRGTPYLGETGLTLNLETLWSAGGPQLLGSDLGAALQQRVAPHPETLWQD